MTIIFTFKHASALRSSLCTLDTIKILFSCFLNLFFQIWGYRMLANPIAWLCLRTIRNYYVEAAEIGAVFSIYISGMRGPMVKKRSLVVCKVQRSIKFNTFRTGFSKRRESFLYISIIRFYTFSIIMPPSGFEPWLKLRSRRVVDHWNSVCSC